MENRYPETITDEALAKKARGGDALAEEELLQRYKETVRSKAHLYFMLGSDSEDVVQEGMIGLFRAIRSFEEGRGAGFATYADRCINRQILNAITAASRQKHIPLNEALSLDRPVQDAASLTLGEILSAGAQTDPEALALAADTARLMLSDEAHVLSGMEREVLSHLMDGEDYREIAVTLGKSPKSIDNCIQRIRKKVRIFFE